MVPVSALDEAGLPLSTRGIVALAERRGVTALSAEGPRAAAAGP
jgi:hypothetical protein